MRTLVIAIAFSAFAGSVGNGEVRMTRVPIELEGVTVSVEMPKKWADSEFGIRSVPTDVRARVGRSGRYVICEKTISARRSLFRGELGRTYVDITLVLPSLNSGGWVKETERTRAYEAKLRSCDFRKPKDLFALHEIGFLQQETERVYVLSFVEKAGRVWVRLVDVGDAWHGVPRLEKWFIGITADSYVRFDLAVAREYSGRQGEEFLRSALFWQNKMIESLTVTGLEQDLTGVEDVETWHFPKVLEDTSDLAK